jgi:hypothetical protein
MSHPQRRGHCGRKANYERKSIKEKQIDVTGDNRVREEVGSAAQDQTRMRSNPDQTRQMEGDEPNRKSCQNAGWFRNYERMKLHERSFLQRPGNFTADAVTGKTDGDSGI